MDVDVVPLCCSLRRQRATVAERKSRRKRRPTRTGHCNEAGSCDCVLCWQSCVACFFRVYSIDVGLFRVRQNRIVDVVFVCLRCCFGFGGAASLRPPLRPRTRRLVNVSGSTVRRQGKVPALFLKHITRLWKECAEESARTNRATLAHAMS